VNGSAVYLGAVDPVRLAHELARRMREVVPRGVEITVEGDMIWFQSAEAPGKAGTYACQWLYEGQGDEASRLAEACWRALDDLQDYVDESTADPWPGTRGVPGVRARVEGDVVVLWCGDAERPVLQLESLPLHVLGPDVTMT